MRNGFFYTLDAAFALMVLFVAVLVVFASMERGPNEPNIYQLKQVSRDALAVMEKKGYLASSLSGSNATVAFLESTPPSLCMQLEFYRNATFVPVFTAQKAGCLKTGERFETTWRSFVVRNGSDVTQYMARLTAWYKRD